MKKTVQFVGHIISDIDQKAFDILRTCLITPPILAHPDFSLNFYYLLMLVITE
jgi:hypothetical protein